MNNIYYHTQERRSNRLLKPLYCSKPYAWLGDGFYFWVDYKDAAMWGNESKRGSGWYEIYKSEIKSKKILNTVFNEKQYYFWKRQIEKIAQDIFNKTGKKATIREMNQFIRKRNLWKDVDGILYQDISKKDELIVDFYYRKRIQLVIYNDQIIVSFIFHKEGECDVKP